jgi:hypothetical protein
LHLGKLAGKEDKLLILPATAITLKKMKSGGCHRFSLNKQLKLPYELCFSPKTNQPKKVQKIRYAKLNQGTSSGAVLFHSYTLFYPGICIYFLRNKKNKLSVSSFLYPEKYFTFK